MKTIGEYPNMTVMQCHQDYAGLLRTSARDTVEGFILSSPLCIVFYYIMQLSSH